MMSLKVVAPVLAVGIGLGGAIAFQPSAYSQSASGFYCDTASGTPITMYRSRDGGREPWIRWVSDAFSGAGYNPLTRCQQVSGRLETYRVNKQLKFLTVGIMNRERVVCTASQVNGRCEGLIFTLKPGQDAVRTLNNLLAWREGQAGAPSLYESGAVPYIDVRSRLQEGSAAPTPVRPENQQPQPPSSGGALREL